ncbi:MAG: hypothetical protein KAS04_04810, partial [Candidatus Aenigmarchaeota archaeon]|nr:hypothetical protein [Candidatus Aenigmarchaeota archaeon]
MKKSQITFLASVLLLLTGMGALYILSSQSTVTAAESEPTETITYTASTETYCSEGTCWIVSYSGSMFQPDENGIFKPYTDVTKLLYENGKLKIKWNDTETLDNEIDLETVIFSGGEQFEPQDFPDSMNYTIDIENLTHSYKYNI